MGKKPSDNDPKKAAVTREDRLKSALKANLQKRKAQARARDVESKGNEAQ